MIPMRRFGTACLAVLMVACTFLLPACSGTDDALFTATYLDTFDTVLTITVSAPSHTEATHHTTAIHDLIRDLHRELDMYHHYEGLTNLYDLNHAAGQPVTLSRAAMDVLLLGRDFYRKTNGRLNICIGALTTLWHTARKEGRPPDPAAIAAALDHISPDALILDETAMTATLSDPAASVDVGAIAKGYALLAVKQYADAHSLDSLLVNLGGQVMAIGTRPDGQAWTVSIASPTGEDPETVPLSNAVMSTSGDYERTFTANGRTYHHIIDPATGYPADTYHAVTVTLPLEALAPSDAYSTALFLLNRSEGEVLIAEIPGATARWSD